MAVEIRYIELKAPANWDSGPAWIGKVKLSKTGTTVYFDDKALRKRQGVSGNHYDVETGDEYWISRVKKVGTNRHWAGHGKILLARDAVDAFLAITGRRSIDTSKYEIVDIPERYPIDRIHALNNTTPENLYQAGSE